MNDAGLSRKSCLRISFFIQYFMSAAKQAFLSNEGTAGDSSTIATLDSAPAFSDDAFCFGRAGYI
ncbi:hypothetical protein JW998_01965 [candidate division KSB1 bacterium]|nr:hypothetical protein [candidate division KSB1 bacterium]